MTVTAYGDNECRSRPNELGATEFDTRVLGVTGLPVVVSYQCVAGE